MYFPLSWIFSFFALLPLIYFPLILQVEFIVMGGTFMSLPEDYRNYFIKNLHDSLSGHRSCTVQEAVGNTGMA